MESTYRELRKKGIIACRISDEKTYLSNSQKTMKLAHQSILMQYGYNVSQTSELSETVRRKILSILIDNGIMSKTDIISYLDFFISQHKSEKYHLAIEKWKSDRAFVNEYKKGCFEKYTVGNLHK